MKNIITKGIGIQVAMLPFLISMPMQVSAQSTIRMSPNPYVETNRYASPSAASNQQLPQLPFEFEGMSSMRNSSGVNGRKAVYTLQTNQPIHEALKVWASNSDWVLNWQPTVSWKTLRGVTLQEEDVVAAVSEVIDTLRFEGKPIALRVSDGNRVMEVISTEVRND